MFLIFCILASRSRSRSGGRRSPPRRRHDDSPRRGGGGGGGGGYNAESRTVAVFNLSDRTEEYEIVRIFERYGKIEVKIIFFNFITV